MELVIDEQELVPRATRLEDIVAVAIGYQERESQNQVKRNGTHWNANYRLWMMTRDLAKHLGIENRIRPFSGDAQEWDIQQWTWIAICGSDVYFRVKYLGNQLLIKCHVLDDSLAGPRRGLLLARGIM